MILAFYILLICELILAILYINIMQGEIHAKLKVRVTILFTVMAKSAVVQKELSERLSCADGE